MLAYSHPTCLQHDTGPDHPEQPARLQVVLDALRQAWPDQAWLEAPAARRGDLLRVHAQSLVDEVLARYYMTKKPGKYRALKYRRYN